MLTGRNTYETYNHMRTTTPTPANKEDRPYLAVHHWRSYVIFLSRNAPYRLFWLSGIISQLGNWFNYIAIFVLLTKLTGSGHAVSWFLIAKFIPTSFLGPAAGVIADRFSRKTIMIVSDLSRALIVLGFLFVREAHQVWLVYALALVQESIWTFYDPARRASVPQLCEKDELNLANALSGATWSMMLAVGAALGGFVSAWFGWQTAIVLDALTFLISASMISRVSLSTSHIKKRNHVGWKDYLGYNDLKEGTRYVAANPKIGSVLLVKSGWALSGGILVLLTVFGEQVFTIPGGEGGGSGILYSFRGVGAALGPILAWRILGETKPGMYRAIGFSFFISSASYILFSQAQTMLWAAPLVLVGHIGGSIQWVFSTNLLQHSVPNEFRGRVFAAEMALLTFILSLSTYFTGAALAEGIDPRVICQRLALIFLVPGSIWLAYVYTRKPYK